jgi:hypothetical protein
MRVQDLRNYGKGLMDSVPDPESEGRVRQVGETVRNELLKELGDAGMAELNGRLRAEMRTMRTHNWPILRRHGLTSQQYIDSIVQRIAMMKALVDLEGMERAVEIQCRLLDMTMYELMVPIFPSMEDYKACGNYFEAFKEYSKASYDANISTGLHKMEIVEDTDSVLAFNITYCAWHEVAKEFGDPYLCYPSTCYGDEAYIPRALDGSGCRFKRSGTLATGSAVCDFRFEYVGDDGSQQ